MQLDGVSILVNDLVVDCCQVVAIRQVGVGLLEAAASGGWSGGGGGGGWSHCRQLAKHVRVGLCVGQNGLVRSWAHMNLGTYEFGYI